MERKPVVALTDFVVSTMNLRSFVPRDVELCVVITCESSDDINLYLGPHVRYHQVKYFYRVRGDAGAPVVTRLPGIA